MSICRKRTRDDDEDDYEELARVTRQCVLPFRVSPNKKHSRGFSQLSRHKPAPLFTQTVTPADSSEEEGSPQYSSSYQPFFSQPTQCNVSPTLQMDTDIDMADSQPPGSPRYLGQASAMPSPKPSPYSGATAQPTFRNPFKDAQNAISGGRLPTPIYGHFQQSVDTLMDDIPRTQQEIEYEKYVRRRRLPTPIDEDEAMDSFVTLTDLPEPVNHAEHLTPESWAPSTPSPAKSARLSFSMGIRADCDLCRMKVPGHSNHIFKT